MSLFMAAHNGLNLSPGQRAFLKALKGMAISAVITGAAAGLTFVQQRQVNWQTTIITGVVTAAYTLSIALDKYWTSQGDAPLATVAGSVATAVASHSPTPISVPQNNTTATAPVTLVVPSADPVSNI